MRAVVARVGVPFLWIVEGRRACVPLVDVPVRAVERLHHLALLTPKAEQEERKVRVVHVELVGAILFEDDAPLSRCKISCSPSERV